MKKWLILAILFFAPCVHAQTQIQSFAADPATCDSTRGLIYYNTVSQSFLSCGPAPNTWAAFGGGGGGTIGGSIANTQVAFGSAANTISGAANFTFASNQLTVANSGTPCTITPAALSVLCGPGIGTSALSRPVLGPVTITTSDSDIAGILADSRQAANTGSTLGTFCGDEWINASVLWARICALAGSVKASYAIFISATAPDITFDMGGNVGAHMDLNGLDGSWNFGSPVRTKIGGTAQPTVAIGTDNAASGNVVLSNASANAHTTITSLATTSNTIAGFATVPTNNHLVSCASASTVCTLTDSGLVSTGVVTNAAALANNAVVLGGGGQAATTNTAFTTNGTTTMTVGVAGGGSGVLALAGNTSGTSTITAPAVAGTAANPILVSNGLQLPSGTALSFNADVFFSRSSANVLNIGNAIGANNGQLNAATFIGSTIQGTSIYRLNTVSFMINTAPTIAAGGCGGAAAAITSSNGTAAFKVNVGTSNTGTCTITMPAATTDWICSATDITTTSTTVSQTKAVPGGTPTTQITLQNYTDVSATGAWVDSDKIAVLCHGE